MNDVPRETSNALTVALLQMAPAANDQEENRLKGERFCREAALKGADIALFPEMFSIGYTGFEGLNPEDIHAWQDQAIADDSPYIQTFRSLAKELDMAIAATYLQQWDGAPRNAVSLIDRHGKLHFTYGKLHTCDFVNFEAATTPGEDFHTATLDTRLGPVEVGAMICYDREFPESARILMLKGAEIILTPNACILEDIRLHQFQTRAYENAVAVFMTNYPAPLQGGRSVAYGPEGETLVEAGPDESVYLAHVNLPSLRDCRQKSIWGNAYRRPHRYGLLTENEVAPAFQRTDALGRPFERQKR